MTELTNLELLKHLACRLDELTGQAMGKVSLSVDVENDFSEDISMGVDRISDAMNELNVGISNLVNGMEENNRYMASIAESLELMAINSSVDMQIRAKYQLPEEVNARQELHKKYVEKMGF